MKPIIEVRNLGKRYRIGGRQEPYGSLRESLADAARAPLRMLRGNGRGARPHIWALQDVSLSVMPGEVVGIIGQNGAGKSTLLKVLSRITHPTTGRVDLYGRVGSLLEVGTGFHPELTGRENIYLNGAILGMRRREIDRKFDQIVDFASVDQFLDTPVKRYSSGMHMRLAFAVAAHLDTEILLVDEVLAVGDAEFQKKCFRKMRQVGAHGRTVLFVSHNMSAIRHICGRGVILERGRVVSQGEINPVVDDYLARARSHDGLAPSVDTPTCTVTRVVIGSTAGPLIKTFDPVEITVRFTARVEMVDPGLYVAVLSQDHQRLAALDFKDFATVERLAAGESCELGFAIESFPFLPGAYQLEIYLKDMAFHKIELVPQTFPFEVAETPIFGSRKIDRWYGAIGLKAAPIIGARTD